MKLGKKSLFHIGTGPKNAVGKSLTSQKLHYNWMKNKNFQILEI
jgi:hypothetical protein